MGLMVAFLPTTVDADDLAHPDGDPVDELHTTVRYYGDDVDDDTRHALHEHARGIAADTAPFVASIAGCGQLGDDDPRADVLHLASPAGEFEAAYERLPTPGAGVTVYPEYKPHLTVGYGLPDGVVAGIDDTVGVKFDRIAVADGDDWTTYPLSGEPPEVEDEGDEGRVAGAFKLFTKKKRTPAPSFTKKQRDEMAESGEAMTDGSYPVRTDPKFAEDDLHRAVQAIGRAKDRAKVEAHIRKRAQALGLTDSLPPWIAKPGRAAGLTPGWGYATDNDVHADMLSGAADNRTAAAGRRRRDRQKCLHGTKATCHSVRWIAAYTAMRERRGFSKKKAAMIANAMDRAYREGRPWGAPGRKGLIKKRHTV